MGGRLKKPDNETDEGDDDDDDEFEFDDDELFEELLQLIGTWAGGVLASFAFILSFCSAVVAAKRDDWGYGQALLYVLSSANIHTVNFGYDLATLFLPCYTHDPLKYQPYVKLDNSTLFYRGSFFFLSTHINRVFFL